MPVQAVLSRPEGGASSGSHRRPLARLAKGVRRLERCVPALSKLGAARGPGAALATAQPGQRPANQGGFHRFDYRACPFSTPRELLKKRRSGRVRLWVALAPASVGTGPRACPDEGQPRGVVPALSLSDIERYARKNLKYGSSMTPRASSCCGRSWKTAPNRLRWS